MAGNKPLQQTQVGVADAAVAVAVTTTISPINRKREIRRATLLLIEHNMRVIMGACDRIHVIESGRTVAEGPPDEIQANPDVLRAYLGTKSGDARG